MGITIVQSKQTTIKKSVKALILAGGAISGGSFMAGGVKALNDHFKDYDIRQCDMFIGLSSGSLLAAALMAGIRPESILRSLDGNSSHFTALKTEHFYRLNISEFIQKPIDFFMRTASLLPDIASAFLQFEKNTTHSFIGRLWQFLSHPTYDHYDELIGPFKEVITNQSLPGLMELLPSGLFDNRYMEAYIRSNIDANHLTNSFQEAYEMTGKRLYISAMQLDQAKRVLFGMDERNDFTISEAIWASTAIPGFYKPAHINGVDYVDGGVQETADIDTAIAKGANLIVCYNPFRPYESKRFVDDISGLSPSERQLSSSGMVAVLNQIFRALFHSRLRITLEQVRATHGNKSDIVLIEPESDDKDFFALNPLSPNSRVEAARLGFLSTHRSLEKYSSELKVVFQKHGISLSRTIARKKANQMKTAIGMKDLEDVLETVEG